MNYLAKNYLLSQGEGMVKSQTMARMSTTVLAEAGVVRGRVKGKGKGEGEVGYSIITS